MYTLVKQANILAVWPVHNDVVDDVAVGQAAPAGILGGTRVLVQLVRILSVRWDERWLTRHARSRL